MELLSDGFEYGMEYKCGEDAGERTALVEAFVDGDLGP